MTLIEKKGDHKEKKLKTKALALWSEGELSSSDESQEDEVVNVCFMANLEDEVTSQLSSSVFAFTFEELHDAFNELLSEKSFFNPKFSRGRISCHYCGRLGHSINKFFIRNNPLKFKQIWVSKNVVSTNMNGPKI